MASSHCAATVAARLVVLLMAAAAFHLPVDLPSQVAGNSSEASAAATAADSDVQHSEEIPELVSSSADSPKLDLQQLSNLQELRRPTAIVNGTSKVLPLTAIDDGVGEGDVMELPNSEIPLPNHHQFTWTWLQYLTYGAVVKGSCVVGNILAQLSPYPSVKKLRAKGDTGDFDPLPFVTIGANSVQWCFYGVFAWWITGHQGFLILLWANVLGAIAGAHYTATFHSLCHSSVALKSLLRYYYASVIILMMQALAAIALPPQHAMFFEGFMASACSIFVALSPIACIPTVIETRSTESMPVELALVSFLSALLWLTCGFMLMDWWIIIPNIVGAVAGLVAIGLLLTYPRKPRQARRSLMSETTPLVGQVPSPCSLAFSMHGDGCTGGTPSTLASSSLSPAQACWHSHGHRPCYTEDSQAESPREAVQEPLTPLPSPFTAASPGIY